MIYDSALDYFFWKGIGLGVETQSLDDLEMIMNDFPLETEHTQSYIDAIELGFHVGNCLNLEDYKNFFYVEPEEKKEKIFSKVEPNTNIAGNCEPFTGNC